MKNEKYSQCCGETKNKRIQFKCVKKNAKYDCICVHDKSEKNH